MNILVISSCTELKLYHPDNLLNYQDFKDPETYNIKVQNLQKYKCCAYEMYQGKQHLFVKQGLELLRKKENNFPFPVDFSIISAGYGYINEKQLIYPYECTFNTMKSKEIKEWSDFLKITDSLNKNIQGKDLIIFLLGKKYLQAINFKSLNLVDKRLVFFTSDDIPLSNYVRINCSVKEAKEFGCGLISLKGFLFKLLCNELVKNPNLCYNIDEYILNKYKKYNTGKVELF